VLEAQGIELLAQCPDAKLLVLVMDGMARHAAVEIMLDLQRITNEASEIAEDHQIVMLNKKAGDTNCCANAQFKAGSAGTRVTVLLGSPRRVVSHERAKPVYFAPCVAPAMIKWNARHFAAFCAPR
jgi:hypothetical protein